jgi:hypothetical protein
LVNNNWDFETAVKKYRAGPNGDVNSDAAKEYWNLVSKQYNDWEK